jgi:hypothetical protein
MLGRGFLAPCLDRLGLGHFGLIMVTLHPLPCPSLPIDRDQSVLVRSCNTWLGRRKGRGVLDVRWRNSKSHCGPLNANRK